MATWMVSVGSVHYLLDNFLFTNEYFCENSSNDKFLSFEKGNCYDFGTDFVLYIKDLHSISVHLLNKNIKNTF